MSYCFPRRLTLRARDGMMARRVRSLFTSALIVVWALAGATALSAQTAPIATVALTPGWVTFGQVVPKGFARDGLRVGSLATQTDVKTRWDDGSIRFAVVTVKADAAGSFAITAAPASGPQFDAPFIPAASVTFTIGGVPYVATLPAALSADRWLTGPNVYEGRSVVAPVSSSGAHPFLRVNFDTRSYSDGTARVDVSVENVLDQAGATTVTYDVTIAVNGATVWSKAALQHFYLTRWRKVFDIGSGSAGSIAPDLTPFHQAGALPPYLGLVANVVDRTTDATGALRPAFDVLGQGALNNPMWDHAGRPELAPYPDWTARYLVHKDPTQRAFVLANGDLSGSWPFHIREPLGSITPGVGPDRFISLDQRPTVWLDDRASTDPIVRPEDRVKGGPMQMHEYGTGIPGPGQSPLGPDLAHQPSLAYVPYLLTGDRYYGEEMGFIANYNLIHTYNGDAVRGSLGILENNEVRGFGWALRNLVDAAAYAPSADTRAYFSLKVQNNLQWLDTNANSQDPVTNPLKLLWTKYRPEPGYISLWEQTYLAFAIDRARAQGFTGGLDHRDAIARLQLRLFTSAPDYPRESPFGCGLNAVTIPCVWGAPYLIAAGHVPNPSSWAGFTFFTTMADIAHNTIGDPNLQRDYAGFYGPEARLNLMIGITSGWTGAKEAYDYLFPFIGVSNANCSAAYGGRDTADRPDLACRAGWALDFYPPTPAPPVNRAPVVTAIADRTNQVGDAASLAVQAIDPDSDPLTYSATGLPGGLAINPATGAISGTFTTAGDFAVVVSVSDGSLSATASFTWHVVTPPPVNHPPVIAPIADQRGEQGESATVAIAATDADHNPLTYSAIGLPGSLVIDPATGIISGTLAVTGEFPVSISVSDGTATASTSFVWRVFRRASIVAPAPGSTFTSSTQAFTWEAGVGVASTRLDIGSAPGLADIFAGQFGTTLVQIVAGLPVDGRQLFVRLSSSITGEVRFNDYTYTAFTFVNHPPAIAPIANQAGHVGDAVTLGVHASDADNDALTYRASGLPDGLTIDATTGAISGTLARADSFTVTVTVSDGAATASTTFAWIVAVPPPPPNLPPVVAPIADQTSTLGDTVSLAIAATDPEGKPLSFSATGLPAGLTINPSSGVISGILLAIGDFTVTVSATDGTSIASTSFVWHVARPAGLVTELKNPGPQQNRAGDNVDLQLEVVYNALAVKLAGGEERLHNLVDFSARNLPRGLRIDREKARIRGHIDNDAAGVYQVIVTVTEVGGRQVSQTFEWTVLPRLRTRDR